MGPRDSVMFISIGTFDRQTALLASRIIQFRPAWLGDCANGLANHARFTYARQRIEPFQHIAGRLDKYLMGGAKTEYEVT